MKYRVDHHFNLDATSLSIIEQKDSNKVWLYTSTFELDFTIEFSPHHLEALRQLVAKLEEAETRMHQAEILNDSLEAEKYSDIPSSAVDI